MKLNRGYIYKIEEFGLKIRKKEFNTKTGKEYVINEKEDRFFTIGHFGYMTSSVIRFARKTLNKMLSSKVSYFIIPE